VKRRLRVSQTAVGRPSDRRLPTLKPPTADNATAQNRSSPSVLPLLLALFATASSAAYFYAILSHPLPIPLVVKIATNFIFVCVFLSPKGCWHIHASNG